VLFPAESNALMVMMFVPNLKEILEVDQLVVPEAVPLAPLAALVQVTFVTPTLSDAFPDSLMLKDFVV
jgi:hypothetical protein